MLEYMNSSIRTSSVDKSMVHNVHGALENSTKSELLNLIKKMNNDQQVKNKEFESCIVNLR